MEFNNRQRFAGMVWLGFIPSKPVRRLVFLYNFFIVRLPLYPSLTIPAVMCWANYFSSLILVLILKKTKTRYQELEPNS
jgi:hypothetical protein